jgi:hypothetical protein
MPVGTEKTGLCFGNTKQAQGLHKKVEINNHLHSSHARATANQTTRSIIQSVSIQTAHQSS